MQALPVHAAGAYDLKDFIPLCGPAVKRVVDTGMTQHVSFNQLWADRLEYLENTINYMLFRTYNEFLKELFEMRETQNTRLIYERTFVPKARVEQTPEGVLPEQGERRMIRLEAETHRYALQTSIRAENLTHPDGARHAAEDLTRLVKSIEDKLEQLAIERLVCVTKRDRDQAMMTQGRAHSLQEIFLRMFGNFDILKKDKEGRGVLQMIAEAKDEMRDFLPTHIIVPHGIKSLVSLADKFGDHRLRGPEGREIVEKGAESVGENVLSGFKVMTYRDPHVAGHEMPFLRQVAQFGGFFIMDDHTLGAPQAGNYDRRRRDVCVYDNSQVNGDYVQVKFLEALRATGRWDATGYLDAPFHQQMGNRAYIASVENSLAVRYIEHDQQGNEVPPDMLLTAAGAGGRDFRAVQDFAQIHSHYLPVEVLKQWAESYASQNPAPTYEIAGNVFNHPPPLDGLDAFGLPRMQAAQVAQSGVPMGFGNPAGAFSIAHSDAFGAAERTAAREFVAGAEKFYTASRKYFGDAADEHDEALLAKHLPHVTPALATLKQRVAAFSMEYLHDGTPTVHVSEGGGVQAVPYTGNIDSAPESEDTEAIGSVQTALAQGNTSTAAINEVFASNESFASFVNAYSQSAFASSYARSLKDRAVRDNRTFGLFTRTALQKHADNPARLAAVLDNAIKTVKEGKTIPSTEVSSTVESWAATQVDANAAAQYTKTNLSIDPREAHSAEMANVHYYDATSKKMQTPFEAAQTQAVGSKRSRQGFAASSVNFRQAPFMANETSDDARILSVPVNLRPAAGVLLALPATAQVIAALHNDGVMVPFSIIGFRPIKTIETATVIIVSSPPGYPVGVTAVGHLMTTQSMNSDTRIMSIHVSFRAGSLVVANERVLPIPHVCSVRYLFGCDLSVIQPGDFNVVRLDENTGSVMYSLNPIGALLDRQKLNRVVDIRGAWSTGFLQRNATPHLSQRISRSKHYPCPLAMVKRYDLANQMERDPELGLTYEENRMNFVCAQEPQHVFNVRTGHFNDHVTGVGPMGDDVHPGHARKLTMGPYYYDNSGWAGYNIVC